MGGRWAYLLAAHELCWAKAATGGGPCGGAWLGGGNKRGTDQPALFWFSACADSNTFLLCETKPCLPGAVLLLLWTRGQERNKSSCLYA